MWKEISGFDGLYLISNKGKVISKHRNKTIILKSSLSRNGYEYVDLYKNGIAYRKSVHFLVASSFLKNDNGYTEIHHKDHNRSNNSYDNLEWCTHEYNMQESVVNKYGEYKDSHDLYETHKCKDCGKPIRYKSVYCKSCCNKHIKRIYSQGRPLKREEVIKSLKLTNGNFTKSSKYFNMTDNALRKWCKKYDLPYRSGDWKSLKSK